MILVIHIWMAVWILQTTEKYGAAMHKGKFELLKLIVSARESQILIKLMFARRQKTTNHELC